MTRLLVASDFDGTLAPIRDDPDAVEIDPAAREVLDRASRVPEVEVALVSGRNLDDLRRRAGGIRAWYSGSHGHEIAGPDGTTVQAPAPWEGRPDAEWIDRATAAGLRLEPKRFGLGLHWRGIEGVDENHPLVREFEAWAAANGLEIVRGRRVAEAAVPGATKRDVLATLVEMTHAQRLLYAGDDLTDFDALRFAATRGRGFFMASPERPEPPGGGVETLHSRDELLREILEEVAQLNS